MQNDVAVISIGHIPEIDLSDYYTKEQIDTTLTSYGTGLRGAGWKIIADDPNMLLSYMVKLTNSGVDISEGLIPAHTGSKDSNDNWYTPWWSALLKHTDYKDFKLGLDRIYTLENASYVTASQLDEMSYATQQYVQDEISQIPAPDMSNYYTKTDVDTTLSSYINTAQYDSSSHNILLQHNSTTIATIDASPFIIDGMVENVVVSNGNLIQYRRRQAGHNDTNKSDI